MAKKAKLDDVTLTKIEYAKACGNMMVQFTEYCLGCEEAQKSFCEVFSQGVGEHAGAALKLCMSLASSLTASMEAQKEAADVPAIPEKVKKEPKAKAPVSKPAPAVPTRRKEDKPAMVAKGKRK